MASNYWLKLYYEMLEDPKVARLPDSSWRRFVECLLLAGELDEGGFLPSIEDMAWRLRVSDTAMRHDMARLGNAELVELAIDDDGRERWFVSNFAKRQGAATVAERVRRHRDQKKKRRYYGDGNEDDNGAGNEAVTIRYTDIDKDIDRDTDKDNNGASAPILAAPAAEYAEFLQLWKTHFPNKPQPRTDNKTLQGKLRTRLKSAAFRENWQAALERGGRSSFLDSGSWFDAGWFLKNDNNWEKVFNGNYDDGSSTNSRGPDGGMADKFAAIDRVAARFEEAMV